MSGDRLEVLAVEPFFGGSHRAFLEAVCRQSRHRWTLLTSKPLHWKWRYRVAPWELAKAAADIERPDVVFCSSMLDLPAWRGHSRKVDVMHAPTVTYFHESQWSYPLHPSAKPDHQYGYANLITALESDECWFNSHYHRDDFLRESKSFVKRMPDSQELFDFDALAKRSRVIYPGFDPPEIQRPVTASTEPTGEERPLRIGWVSRWEHDKQPDQFLELLKRIHQDGIEYELILCGARPRVMPQEHQQIVDLAGPRLVADAYAATRKEYWNRLGQMDVVVSTAAHEFYGIAVCEAIWAGAVAILPNRLSYPELVSQECLYESLDHGAEIISALRNRQQREQIQADQRDRMRAHMCSHTVKQIDDQLVAVSRQNRK